MDPLNAVENILGGVETWPSSIIIDLFVTKPCTISVKCCRFMNGNNVPVEKVVDCFVACVGIDSYYVSCAAKDWYSTWNNLSYKTHFERYFSVTFKRWIWIYGKYASQHEAVWPKNLMNAIVNFGTENTGCPLIINTTIRRIRSSTSVV